MTDIATPTRILAAELVAFTDVTSLADAYVHRLPGRTPEGKRLATAHAAAGDALARAASILAAARDELDAALAAYTDLPIYARG